MREGKETEVAVTVGPYQARAARPATHRARARPAPAAAPASSLRPVGRAGRPRRQPRARARARGRGGAPRHRGGGRQVQALFPSDRQTVPDPRQSTGRRVALAMPDCGVDAAGCDETRLVNELDGWSVNPRVAIRFSGRVALDSVTKASAFILPLAPEPLASPIGLGQLVWDGRATRSTLAPERALLQARRYALVLTTRVLDDGGQPLAPALNAPIVAEAAYGISAQGVVFQRPRGAGHHEREVAAVTVFTTQSVTAGLEQMRAVLEAGPAPELRFALGPGGARSAYARVEMDGLELRRHVATDPGAPLEEAVTLPLGLVPPTDIRTIAVGRFSAIFLTPDRIIPATRPGTRRPRSSAARTWTSPSTCRPAPRRPAAGRWRSSATASATTATSSP